jgi:hypothetical protein
VLRIPDGANDATLIPYLMFVTVGGMAKDVLRIENQRLAAEGKTELHGRADNGDGIMDLMCMHFYQEDENAFLLCFSQLVRTCWRDERSPQESLKQYQHRMNHLMREASAYYNNAVAPVPELTFRLLFIAGLPAEVQSIVTTQKAVCWDNPELKPSEIQQLYEMIFASDGMIVVNEQG